MEGKVRDMEKIECPFVREEIDGQYIVTDKITEGYGGENE